MPDPSRDVFVVKLQATTGPPEDSPDHVRLRQVLKRLLRTWGFRCVGGWVEKAPAASQALGEGEKADQESSAGQNGLAGR